MRSLVLITVLAALLAGCDESLTAPSRAEIAGRWQLASFQTASGDVVRPPAGTSVGIEFADDRASVQSDCNSCGGEYTLNGTAFKLSPMACTRRACVAESIEGPYLQLLGSADTATLVSDGVLKISGPAGSLTFVR